MQAETLELAFDECRLSDQALQDLEEALRLSLRLRHLTLLDVLPGMLSMVAGLSGLEELSLVNISGTDADLGPSLQVYYIIDMPLVYVPSHYNFQTALCLHPQYRVVSHRRCTDWLRCSAKYWYIHYRVE